MGGTEYDSFLRDQFEAQLRKHPVYPHQSNPKEWYPGQGGVASIFQDEVSSIDPIGAISPAGAQKALSRLPGSAKIGGRSGDVGKFKRVMDFVKGQVFKPHAVASKKAISGFPAKALAPLEDIAHVNEGFNVHGSYGDFSRDIAVNPSSGRALFSTTSGLPKHYTKIFSHELGHSRQYLPGSNITDKYTSGLLMHMGETSKEYEIGQAYAKSGKQRGTDKLGLVSQILLDDKIYRKDPTEIHSNKFTKAVMPFFDKKAGTVVIDEKRWDALYRQTLSDTFKELKADWGKARYSEAVGDYNKWIGSRYGLGTSQVERWFEDIRAAREFPL